MLQVKDSVLDLLCTSLIPELGSDITAGTSCNEESVLVAVATVRALPHQFAIIVCHDLDLAVIATFLTVVALGVELCIENVVIYESHNFKDCVYIVLEVWNLDITDSTAW